jgi:hypothetical protein
LNRLVVKIPKHFLLYPLDSFINVPRSKNKSSHATPQPVSLLCIPFFSAHDYYENIPKILFTQLVIMKPKMCFKVLLAPLNTKIMPKIASLELRTTEKVMVAELQLRSNISLKSFRIAIAEVLPSNCGIAIADQSGCACPALVAMLGRHLPRVAPMAASFKVFENPQMNSSPESLFLLLSVNIVNTTYYSLL